MKKQKRNDLIVRLVLEGDKTLAEIGNQFNITRQRVGQVLVGRGIKKNFGALKEYWQRNLECPKCGYKFFNANENSSQRQ